MAVELPIKLEVGVLEAEVKELADCPRCERRGKDVRVLLQAGDGGVHGAVHIAVGIQGDDVQGEVVGVGGSAGGVEVLDELVGIFEADGGCCQGFQDVGEEGV